MQKTIQQMFMIFMMLFLAIGCATSFTGSAHIEKKLCQNKCQESGMDLAGMVFMGEYSSGCICRIPNKTSMRQSQETEFMAAAGSSAAAGVMMQMQREAERQNSGHPNAAQMYNPASPSYHP
ncbi:MAG: hypothetical protein HYV97_16585 [Bdellovibrio sp.]|nr:hypothetical protein [Bdellovibrio sp.]